MYMTWYNTPSYFVKVFKNKYGVLPKDFMKRIIELSNPQKITCIIFENLFGPYFLPHQSHSYGYAPSSGENLTSKIQFKSDAT